MKNKMLLPILIFSISGANPTFAMDEDKITGRSITSPLREKTADEIIAEHQHQPEFMNCATWLKTQHPDFTEEKFSQHPLFSTLIESKQLVDFEVDTLEQFMHQYMETDMIKEQIETLMTLRFNSMSTKAFLAEIIDILQEKKTINELILGYLKSRFKNIIVYQSELLGRKKHILSVPSLKAERSSEIDCSDLQPVYASFKRVYNTKNKIIRTLLYYLKDQGSVPLNQRLSPELTSLIRLSRSLLPYFNKENEQWVDYDQALSMGEASSFLGNARALRINLKEFFGEEKITGYRIPKSYKKFEECPLPLFLYAEPPKITVSKQNKATANSKNNIANSSENTTEETMDKDSLEASVLPTSNHPPTGEAQVNESKKELVSIPISLKETEVNVPKKEKTTSTANIHKKSLNLSTASPRIKQSNKTSHKIGSTHISTICDIFRNKGYTQLNDTKIINAWENALREKGYHKKDTARSHQPLYAELDDGTHVVLGLFRSSGYGKNYIKYIQAAFEKIGFGRSWLESQGYVID